MRDDPIKFIKIKYSYQYQGIDTKENTELDTIQSNLSLQCLYTIFKSKLLSAIKKICLCSPSKNCANCIIKNNGCFFFHLLREQNNHLYYAISERFKLFHLLWVVSESSFKLIHKIILLNNLLPRTSKNYSEINGNVTVNINANAKPKPNANAKPKPKANAKPKPNTNAKPKPNTNAKTNVNSKPNPDDSSNVEENENKNSKSCLKNLSQINFEKKWFFFENPYNNERIPIFQGNKLNWHNFEKAQYTFDQKKLLEIFKKLPLTITLYYCYPIEFNSDLAKSSVNNLGNSVDKKIYPLFLTKYQSSALNRNLANFFPNLAPNIFPKQEIQNFLTFLFNAPSITLNYKHNSVSFQLNDVPNQMSNLILQLFKLGLLHFNKRNSGSL